MSLDFRRERRARWGSSCPPAGTPCIGGTLYCGGKARARKSLPKRRKSAEKVENPRAAGCKGEPEGRTIGIWGQRHLRHIRKHKVSLYAELLTTGKLNDYLADLNEQAEAMFSRLVKQLSEKEGVTEALKAENQMMWVQRMNNIHSAAMEIVASELIYC